MRKIGHELKATFCAGEEWLNYILVEPEQFSESFMVPLSC